MRIHQIFFLPFFGDLSPSEVRNTSPAGMAAHLILLFPAVNKTQAVEDGNILRIYPSMRRHQLPPVLLFGQPIWRQSARFTSGAPPGSFFSDPYAYDAIGLTREAR